MATNEEYKAYDDAVNGENSVTATYIDEAGQKQQGTTTPNLDYWTQMSNYYTKAYDDAVAANNKAAQNAAQQALDTTNRQIETLQGQYKGTNEELYRNYMAGQKNIDQQLAASGYTGGLSESTRVGMEANYNNALNANQKSLADQIAALQAAYTGAQYQAQANADAANASAMQTLYGNQANLMANQHSEQQSYDQAAAQTMAGVGDYSGYVKMGIMTQEQANLMHKAWVKQNEKLAKKLYPGEFKSSGHYSGTSQQSGDTTGQTGGAGAGGNTTAANDAINSITAAAENIPAGMRAPLNSYVDSVMSRLTPAEQQYVISVVQQQQS